jgi:rhodanese-related sulfurtransferase
MPDYEISPSEAADLLRNGAAKFVDVREPWEFATAHIEGSQLLPMNEIPSRLHELDRSEHLVIVCHLGVRSLQAAVWLRRQGFEQAQSLSGGIDAWSLGVDPAVPRY